MPHIIVKWVAGRTEEQKHQLADAITRVVMDSAGVTEDAISVAIVDVNPEDWVEAVYKPDIEGKWAQVYKKPGYDPTA